MIKSHEIDLAIEKFDDMVSGNVYIIIENSDTIPFEKGDYILIHKTNEGVKTGDVIMTRIEFVNSDEGLKSGYVLLKLNQIN